jgi:hypothetical protein
MSAIQSKKFNWIARRTAWQESQAWRAKRRAMAEEFQSNTTALASSLGAAQANQIAGFADNAIKAGVARIQAAAKAKLNTLA